MRTLAEIKVARDKEVAVEDYQLAVAYAWHKFISKGRRASDCGIDKRLDVLLFSDEADRQGRPCLARTESGWGPYVVFGLTYKDIYLHEVQR